MKAEAAYYRALCVLHSANIVPDRALMLKLRTAIVGTENLCFKYKQRQDCFGCPWMTYNRMKCTDVYTREQLRFPNRDEAAQLAKRYSNWSRL